MSDNLHGKCDFAEYKSGSGLNMSYLIKISELIEKSLLEIGDGYRAKNTELDSKGFPFARAGNLNNGFNFENTDLLCEKSVLKAKTKVSRLNDCVITTKGTFGRVGFVNKNVEAFVYSPQLCYWRVFDTTFINPKFLFYWLQGSEFLAQAFQVKSSTDMADYASLTDQRSMSITLPPIKTQKKIAAVLSAYDDLIENNKRRIALLEKMAEEIYREWFVRMRFPGSKETKFEKGVPVGWEQKAVGDICKVARGSSPRPINDKRYFDNGTIPWIKIADATASKMFIYETKEHVNDFGASFSRKLPKGSLIIAASGTLGFCIFLGVEGCVHDGWMYLSDYEYETKPIFFYYVINYFGEHLNNLSYGAAIQNINTEIIRRLQIFLPPKNVLRAFYYEVEPLHEKISYLAKMNKNLEITRDLLLSRLISGKLSVENLDIQFPPSMQETMSDTL